MKNAISKLMVVGTLMMGSAVMAADAPAAPAKHAEHAKKAPKSETKPAEGTEAGTATSPAHHSAKSTKHKG
ncbi:hypothetical protein F0U62_47855 [Cystobacter fuscus]|uniref:hypothetical protein n=1 Tax=Cystobacter fuscus TaxID=43 RepID=UPI002B3215F2|nr:hypothetical protein F0U62_47855 [Cystobacter fuscus]